MGLAILTGSCWRALRETIPGFTVVEESRVVLVATRALEPHQRDRLAASQRPQALGFDEVTEASPPTRATPQAGSRPSLRSITARAELLASDAAS
jgi:hypothetical protein